MKKQFNKSTITSLPVLRLPWRIRSGQNQFTLHCMLRHPYVSINNYPPVEWHWRRSSASS